MTGYGAGTAEKRGIAVEAEVQSVNHRGLVVQTYGPREWGALETDLTALIRDRFARGKFNVSLGVSRIDASGRPTVNWEGVRDRVELFKDARKRFGGETDSLPDDVLYRILQDSQKESGAPDWEESRDAVVSAVEGALGQLLQMRTGEGDRLNKEFAAHTRTLEDLLDTIRQNDRNRIPNHRDTLLSRLRDMQLELDVTDERVAKEVAFLADRSDISEETARVESHLTALRQCFDSPEPVGRRLEFLLQEIQREFNTTGSKASLPAISEAVIEAKQAIEKLREQAANIE